MDVRNLPVAHKPIIRILKIILYNGTFVVFPQLVPHDTEMLIALFQQGIHFLRGIAQPGICRNIAVTCMDINYIGMKLCQFFIAEHSILPVTGVF